MKKLILIIFLTAFGIQFGNCYGQDLENSVVADPQDIIFRSSLTEIVEDLNDMTNEEYSDDRYFNNIDPDRMPFIKQMRLKISNKCLERTLYPKEKKSLITRLKELKTGKKITQSQEEISMPLEQTELTDVINKVVNNDDGTLSLEGGINAEKTERQLMLDSEYITFDDETGDMHAIGRPILYLPPQNTKIVSDTMTYNEGGNILKASGNVIVTKDNVPMETDELEINMNEETLSMDKLHSNISNMKINAQSALQQDGLIIFNQGNFTSDNSYIHRIDSKMGGPRFRDMLPDPDMEALFFGDPDRPIEVHASNIEVDARKNHDVIKAKKLEFSRNGRTFFKWPSVTMYTNKNHDYFEGNYPEFGSRRKLGVFAGPGFAFGGPFGSVVKLVPFVNYRSSEWGIGGLLKYMNTYNKTELGYGSSKDIFFLKGKQRLDDNLYFHYAYNSYINEWFLGGRMPKYAAEVFFDKSYPNKDFLGEGRNMVFHQRASFGFMKDDNKSYNGEHYYDATNMSTTRTRYMAEVNQTWYQYKDEDNMINIRLSTILQGSAALYGTGDTQFIARFGPRLKIQYKNWMQDLTYYLTGYNDQTPLPHFDAYRYGHSSVRLTEAFRLTKYLSVGWSGYVNLSDDAPNRKVFQENAFLVALGPEDFKFIFGYDFIRDRTYIGFNIAFDPKGTNVTYDKMIIKNPERLGKKSEDENEHKIAFETSEINNSQSKDKKILPTKTVKDNKPKVLQYATVIDLEDPDKERID